MAKIGKRPLDDEQLEGGGKGAGMGSSSVKDTKWSGMPSFKSNASIMDDIKKLTKDTSHLKGGAKKSTELAEDRAAKRMAVRAAGAAAAGAAAKAATSEDKPKKAAAKSEDYEDLTGDVSIDPSNPTGVAGKGMKKGGMTASRRGDGIAQRGKTRGTLIR
jgi:hypothetical protein